MDHLPRNEPGLTNRLCDQASNPTTGVPLYQFEFSKVTLRWPTYQEHKTRVSKVTLGVGSSLTQVPTEFSRLTAHTLTLANAGLRVIEIRVGLPTIVE
jgi:hypothetical protein